MFRCTDCGHMFESGEERVWEERHGFTDGKAEKFSGCPLCGEPYDEIKPCAICGAYPEDEYEDGELEGGICKECLAVGVDEYFDKYLDDRNVAIDFYIGSTDGGGYAYTPDEAVEILRKDYLAYAKQSPENARRNRMYFLEETDIDDFCKWLIERK